MTYANAVLPQAMFIAAEHWPQEGFLDVAQASFAFLDRTTTGNGREKVDVGPEAEAIFWPVGNSDWYSHGEAKSPYDQQPVEAATMAAAALTAFDMLGEQQYLAAFRRAHAWFHGQNSLHQPLGDVQCGACCDGLQASGRNRNQGAESTLAYLWTELLHEESRLLSVVSCQLRKIRAPCPRPTDHRPPTTDL
jgi:hypothetical protein